MAQHGHRLNALRQLLHLTETGEFISIHTSDFSPVMTTIAGIPLWLGHRKSPVYLLQLFQSYILLIRQIDLSLHKDLASYSDQVG